jgi:multisubunit Na+/H+ antiporter MnhB subunit
MKDTRLARLTLFGLLAIGIALVLVGALAPDLVPFQLRLYLPAEQAEGFLVRSTVEYVLHRLAGAVQIGLWMLGGLIIVLSAVGIWSLPGVPSVSSAAIDRRNPAEPSAKADCGRVP